MFDMGAVKARHFNVKIGERKVDIEPPKLKVMKKLSSINESDLSGLQEVVKQILNKNRQHYKFSDELIEEINIDQLKAFLSGFAEWMTDTKNDPN